ncbi:hypothetical protein ACJMK2_023387 [Sinanodonta woodiana]|uniref:Uncharacterized protein n=1 Tax=Sinanodonta woodiana TaxID=1069815 RepID=A0ABD3T425_SINWO
MEAPQICITRQASCTNLPWKPLKSVSQEQQLIPICHGSPSNLNRRTSILYQSAIEAPQICITRQESYTDLPLKPLKSVSQEQHLIPICHGSPSDLYHRTSILHQSAMEAPQICITGTASCTNLP